MRSTLLREQASFTPGSRPDHSSTPERRGPTSSRLSDYSLVKEHFGYPDTPQTLACSPRRHFSRLRTFSVPIGEADISVRLFAVNRCRELFCSRHFRLMSDRCRTPSIGQEPVELAGAVFGFVWCCKEQRAAESPFMPQFKHHSDDVNRLVGYQPNEGEYRRPSAGRQGVVLKFNRPQRPALRFTLQSGPGSSPGGNFLPPPTSPPRRPP